MRESGCGAVEGGLTFGDMARESNAGVAKSTKGSTFAHGQVALCPILPGTRAGGGDALMPFRHHRRRENVPRSAVPHAASISHGDLFSCGPACADAADCSRARCRRVLGEASDVHQLVRRRAHDMNPSPVASTAVRGVKCCGPQWRDATATTHAHVVGASAAAGASDPGPRRQCQGAP